MSIQKKHPRQPQQSNPCSAYDDDTIESAKAKAASLGRAVVFPTPNELFIDIDSTAAMGRFLRGVTYLSGVTYLVRPSPSGRPGRFHIVVTMRHPVTPLERIALQAMLGSDPVREMLSWMRIQRGIDEPTIFFEIPEPTTKAA